MIEIARSGGQSGTDLSSLMAAKVFGIPTGGWMPLGFLTQDGFKPEYVKLYNMKEHRSGRYSPRTYLNVKENDGTVRLAVNFLSAGEICTFKAIQQYKKPYLDIDLTKNVKPDILIKWIYDNQIKSLNFAGNSEKTYPGMFKLSFRYLCECFRLMDFTADINRIKCY